MDGHRIEVQEPGQRVLVHGVDVWQVGDAEEQNRRMFRDRSVTLARLVDLLLRFHGNLKCDEIDWVRCEWSSEVELGGLEVGFVMTPHV